MPLGKMLAIKFLMSLASTTFTFVVFYFVFADEVGPSVRIIFQHIF